jgi:hypothetical protein
MKKRTLSIVATTLILAFALSISASASLLRASLYLSSYSAWATKYSNGSIAFSFDVIATDISDSVGATQVQIQRRSSSSASWSTVQTYTSATRASLLGSNCASHGDTINYTGTSGYQYRSVVTCYAANNGGSDSRTATSNVVTA